MYLSFFNFKTKPFSNTFQKDFLYINEYNRLLLKALLKDLDDHNIQLITGEPGSGKTCLIKSFLENLPPQLKQIKINYIAHEESDFIRFIALELGLKAKSTKASIINTINKLHKDYVRILLVVDDADKLGRGPLKLLFDIAESLTKKGCPFNLILIGLPELKSFIEKEGLLEAFQDNYKSYFVSNLYKEDVDAYIKFRLTVAGADGIEIFDSDAISAIYNQSKGLPRVINMICDACLLNAYLMNKRKITEEIVKSAVDDLQLDEDFKLAILNNPLSPMVESSDISPESPSGDRNKREEMEKTTLKKELPLEDISSAEELSKAFSEAVSFEDENLPVRVLILEASARMRMHYENYFTQKGVDFRIFKEFNNLFAYLRESSGRGLDILIADSDFFFIKGGLESPEGMKALGILLRDFSFLPVIITSTLPLSIIRNKLLQKGLAYFVCKPELKDIDLSELKTRLTGFFRELDRFREFIERQFTSFYLRVMHGNRVK